MTTTTTTTCIINFTTIISLKPDIIMLCILGSNSPAQVKEYVSAGMFSLMLSISILYYTAEFWLLSECTM